MEWSQTLLIALITLVATKVVDYFVGVFSEKREFRKKIRDRCLEEIEQLKDEVGIIYEIASNWKGFGDKEKDYAEVLSNESRLIGKYNKYPSVAMAARDTIHHCKIVMDMESKREISVGEAKKDLAKVFADFISECNNYLRTNV